MLLVTLIVNRVVGLLRQLARRTRRMWKSSRYIRIPEYRDFEYHSRVYKASLQSMQERHTLSGGTETPTVSVAVDSSLPRLSWRAVLSEGHVRFTLGPWVERRRDGFYEGAWCGNFGDLAGAMGTHAYGSGALITPSGITFLTPKSMYEGLFLIRNKSDGSTVIANSLCHCLAAAGAGDEFLAGKGDAIQVASNRQTAAGSYKYDSLLYADGQYELHALYFNDFSLSADGSISFKPAGIARNFSNYQEYRAYLSSQLAALLRNGSDPRRSRPLGPAASVSRGYDSPAVAVLAKEAGCSRALCLDVLVGDVDDSGVEIAEALGMDVRLHPYPLGQKVGRLATEIPDTFVKQSLEFIASTGLGDDLAFIGMEPSLEGAVLLTGSLGDSIWDKHCSLPPGLPVRIPYGKSITEFRLRVGFACVPVPTIGAFFPRSIAQLSRSPEMRAYSVGGDYDRPIPRRICEEAGIARGAFGTRKSAVNPNPLNRSRLWDEAIKVMTQRYAYTMSAENPPNHGLAVPEPAARQ